MASLVHLDEKDYNKTTALEIAAGGRLYNVVVDNEVVGKDLLQHGRLKKRVTIIPLNKINAHRMPPQVRIPLLPTANEPLISLLIPRNSKQQITLHQERSD